MQRVSIPLDQATPLGSAPAEVLERLEGEHPSSLGWETGSEAFGPERGRSEIAISVDAVHAK